MSRRNKNKKNTIVVTTNNKRNINATCPDIKVRYLLITLIRLESELLQIFTNYFL